MGKIWDSVKETAKSHDSTALKYIKTVGKATAESAKAFKKNAPKIKVTITNMGD